MSKDRIYQKKDSTEKVWMDVHHRSVDIVVNKDDPIIGTIVNYISSNQHTLESFIKPMSATETRLHLKFSGALAMNKGPILDAIEENCLTEYQCTQKPTLGAVK